MFNFRQSKAFTLAERAHQLWIHYFTESTPKTLGSVPKNSPLNAHYSNFNFADFSIKILLMQKAAIESNPSETLPVMLHFDQPISPHYFKFCLTVDTMKVDNNTRTKIAQEIGPQIIRCLVAFTYQLDMRLQDLINKKENAFFPSRFLTEFKYILKFMLSSTGKLFQDFLYLLDPIFKMISTISDQDSIIYQMSIDIITTFMPYLKYHKEQLSELKQVILFISTIFTKCTTQDSLFSDFCVAITTNTDLFPFCFTEDAYSQFVFAVANALDRISSQTPDNAKFEVGLSYLKSIIKTIYRQKKIFDIVPHILIFLKWSLNLAKLPKFEIPELTDEKLISDKTPSKQYEFTSLDLFDDSSEECKMIEVRKLQATYITTSSVLAKTCGLISQLCFRDENITESVLVEFPKYGPKYVYFAIASVYTCPPDKILSLICKTNTFNYYFSREIINESTLLETSKNPYLINLKNLLISLLIEARSSEVPAILSKILDVNHPIVVFKIVQIVNMLISDTFLEIFSRGSSFDVLMRIYESYKTYLIDHQTENDEEKTVIGYMKKSKSEILKFVLSFMESEESIMYIIGNGTRIDFILSLLFENKSFDNGINILCKALQDKKIGLLLSHITSLIKTGFDHLEMSEWRDLYCLLIDCISAAIITNRTIVVKKFISSGSISIFSRIPIAFQHVHDSKEAVLRFLSKILQFFTSLCNGSFRMIKELSNPQWNFVSNMISAIRFVDINVDIIDLITYFTTIGDTLWITTGIELLFVASEKENNQEKILKMLIGFVDSNIANRYQCYIANALSYLLDSIEKKPCELTFKLFSLIGSTFFRMRELSLTLRLLSKSSNELSIQLLKVLIQIAQQPILTEIPKSFLHFTTQNSFSIEPFTLPQTFTISMNALFPFELKKKITIFKLESAKQKLTLWIMDNKFFVDIVNSKKENSFQLCTNLKLNVWYPFKLAITPGSISFYLNSNLVTSSVIPNKFKFLSAVTFSIQNIKCDVEYIRIDSKDYGFYSDFNGKCVNEGVCANTCNQSPIKKASFDGLAVPYMISFINSIPTCGGPRIFLPLFEKVDSEEYLVCLLKLINSISMKNESMFIETQFFRALAYHFLNIKSELITNEVIELLYSIYKTFSIEDIKSEMLSHIFGNFSIWKLTSKENQLMVYSGIFTSIFQFDSPLFNEVIRFDETLLKFTLMYENSDSTDELMQKTTNFLLMMSQSKFTQHDAEVLVGSLMQITSNEMCLNSIILTINIIIDQSKELLKQLEKVNYFKPFVNVLNSRFERTRVISMHSLFYIQSILKTEGTLMSVEMIDSIRLFNIIDTTELSMINLLCYMTNSMNYKDFPRINTVFDFDKILPIEFPQFMPLFTVIISLVPTIKNKALKYLRESYGKYDESRKIVHLCKFWILWFIFLSIIDEENKEEWMNIIGLIILSNDISENLYELFYFSLLLGKPLLEFVKPAIMLQFKQNQTVELAILILRLELFKLETPFSEDCKDDLIHTFSQKILLSKPPKVEFKFIDRHSNNEEEINEQFAKDLSLVTRFLIQQGIEFLFDSTIIPEMLNFTVICYIIDLIGSNQDPDESVTDNEALFHLLIPYIEDLENQSSLEKGLMILIGSFSSKKTEFDELIKILKRIDPIYSPASDDEITGSTKANRDEFNENLKENSFLVSEDFEKKLIVVHESVTKELSRIFNDDSQILADLRVKFSKELYEVQQDTERSLRKNYNFWKTIKKLLSLQNGGPWFSIPADPHYKFDNVLDSIGRRDKLVLNKKFNPHQDAAWESPDQNDEIEEDDEEKNDNKKKVKTANISIKNQVESPNVYSIQLECQMVTVLNNFKGTMYVSKTSIYFEAKETTDVFGEIINKTSKLIEIPNKDIRFILKRRYLCIDCGAEIFTIYNRSFYFTFGSYQQRTTFFKEVEKIKPANLEFIQFGDTAKVYNDLKLRKKWNEGEMTNYEYLWWLNILSGRSIHDISQYPVYPWVIKDYRSRSLDLSDKKNYRDLSKPIGSLNEERLKTIRFLYKETKNTPFACLYRFHYSTPAYVILFLLRKEPFTTLHIQLQNNRFDHPNRLFYSIAAAWDSVNTNSSDFRELIPEFFATPEFLLNSDGYNLGTRFDFVQLKKSLSFGTASEIDKQSVTKSPSLTRVTRPSIISQPQDDSVLEPDETFTSILNPASDQLNSTAAATNTVAENKQSEENKQDLESEENKPDDDDDVNVSLNGSDSLTDTAILNDASQAAVDKVASTSKLINDQPNEDQLESCIAEDNTDIDPANYNDGENKQEITIPYMTNGKVNLSKTELGLAYSPSSHNFVGIKIVKTKKGQLVRRDFKVDDIELPLWAPSASAFIAINRLALESDYVSTNLHKWIDLIFGVKQRSEEADNIFHPFSYVQKEPKDPNELQTLQQHAANFGMVPQCLFTTLHPYRKFRPQPHALQSIECNNDNNGNGQNNSEINNTLFFGVTQIQKFDENILKISSTNGLFHAIFEKDSTFRTYNVSSPNSSNNDDNNSNSNELISSNNSSSNLNVINSNGSSFDSIEHTGNDVHLEFLKSAQIEIPAQLTPRRTFITADLIVVISPPWSQSFVTFYTKSGKKWSPGMKSAHSASVKEIACDIDGGVIVTAAEDSSLFVWDINQKRKISTIVAHVDQIIAVAISSELELVVSCDQRGELIFSSLKTGNFIFKKQLNIFNGMKTAPKKIMLSTLGFVILIYDCIEEDTSHSTRIILIDFGGRFLKEIKFEGKFTSTIIIKNQDCSEYLVMAQETKLVYILRIFDLKIVCFGPVTGVIKDMNYSKDDLSLYFLTKENELLISKFSI